MPRETRRLGPTRASLNANVGVPGTMQPPPPDAVQDDESFISNYQSWSSFKNRKVLDANLAARGMNVPEVLPQREKKFRAASVNPENSEDYKNKTKKNAALAKDMRKRGLAVAAPTGISDIADRYHATLIRGIMRGEADRQQNLPHAARDFTPGGSPLTVENQGQRHDIHTPEGQDAYVREQRSLRTAAASLPGTAWYFDQRREEAARIPEQPDLTARQGAAMGARLSSGKKPEDELVAMSGVMDLRGRDATISGKHISEMHPDELAAHASAAAAWATHAEEGRRGRPEVDNPQTDPETYDALRRAGRGHANNISSAYAIAAGHMTPSESFGDQSPKTSAYGEMKFQSDPANTDVETDYRNVSAHLQDVVLGRQSADQGMFEFSQVTPEQPIHHTLSSRVPTAIDTWMLASGSGQTMRAPVNADGSGGTFSPAKRLVDKDMPLDPTMPTKESLGMEAGNANQTSMSAISAQHNEAIRQVSENRIGALSFNQHGQAIFTPAGLIQEGDWVEERREAGADPAYNARTTLATDQAGQRKRKGLEVPSSSMSSHEEYIQRMAQSDPNPKKWMKRADAAESFGTREYELAQPVDMTPGADNSKIPKRLITPMAGDGTRKSKRGLTQPPT